MIDKEKVLHGLSSCGNDYGTPNICEVTECPYREDEAWCVHGLAHDAGLLIAELLKAQEPHDVIQDNKGTHCPKCNRLLAEACGDVDVLIIDEEPAYCPYCGQAVKWDD